MRAGRLDRLIDIRRKTVTESDLGANVETWANIVARRPTSVRPVKGDERFGNPQIVARDEIEFRIRYSASVADVSPLDQVIYPALDGDSSPVADPEERRVHDIVAVHEIGRQEGLQIIARRRGDVTA